MQGWGGLASAHGRSLCATASVYPVTVVLGEEIIASSEGYKTRASAENGIKAVHTNAPGATVVDKTG